MDHLTLKPGPHRVLQGSPWVYRTELTRLDAAAGSIVRIQHANGRVIGQGFFNPRSMIAVRMLFWGDGGHVTATLFRQRLAQAVRIRQRVTGCRDAYRVVYSEADGIPGLVVDKYGPMLVLEVTSLGLLPFMDIILEELEETFHPYGIYEHGDLTAREREGLPRENRLLRGRLVSPVEIHEHGVRLMVDVVSGQKTGHFLDQYENRGRLALWSAGSQVFDAFCHTGSFALTAAVHKAQSVVGVDINPDAIAQAEANASLNGVRDITRFVAENAFDWLRRESDRGAQYDLGILDPPAFTKSKQSVPQALKGYKEINLRALKLMRPGGIMVTSSCSFHLTEAQFIAVIQAAAHDVRRAVRIIEIRSQGPDHPILPALGESRYLKCLVLTVD